MNTSTQQIPSNPALDFAQSILDVTNNGLELIEILRDIAEDDEKATTNDRIAAVSILNDRAFGKCPKQVSPRPEPDPESAESDNHANHSSDISRSKPESPRLVIQIDDALNDSLGPAPSAQKPLSLEGEGWGEGEKNTLDPNSIHFTIQQHILDITNNGQTLRDILLEIARAEDDPKVTPYHRRRAVVLLLDRALGTNPNAVRSGACPDSSAHPEPSPVVEEEPFDKEAWERVAAELKELEKRYNLDPNRPIRRNVYSHYLPPDDFDLTPYLHEADEFRAKIALQAERRRKWPEIEERRRKKIEQIYPSHSEDDGEPPDT